MGHYGLTAFTHAFLHTGVNAYMDANHNSINLHRVIDFYCSFTEYTVNTIPYSCINFSDCTSGNNYYIGDESDEEDLNEEETVTILSFFNDCSLQELTSVPTMSAKKAEKIIQMRPFDSWDDLVRMLHLTIACSPHRLYYTL